MIAEPRGKPIFKFFAAWGKVHPVTTFFDDGCSDCVMREGVPGIEWEGIITKKGPFNMGGVGGLATLTRDEWMVLVPLANGDKQAVRCFSMDKVTTTFPKYDTAKAVAQVKEDAPDNAELQN